MKKARKSCEQCGSQNLKARITTYPIQMEHFGLQKQLNIGRVSVRECLDCHTLMPTEAGKEKIERCTMSFIQLFDTHGITSV